MSKVKIEDGHKLQGPWILAPIADITIPKPGRMCYGPRWWAVTSKGEVLFYESYNYPQCNLNKKIVDAISKNLNVPPNTPQYIEMVFLPHRCSDYI